MDCDGRAKRRHRFGYIARPFQWGDVKTRRIVNRKRCRRFALPPQSIPYIYRCRFAFAARHIVS